MTTYSTVLVITFFVLIFLASKFNKKYGFYKNDQEKLPVIAVISTVSLFWFFTIPLGVVFGFFYFVAKGSSKLLK